MRKPCATKHDRALDMAAGKGKIDMALPVGTVTRAQKAGGPPSHKPRGVTVGSAFVKGKPFASRF